jgi:hypothetical protein
MEDPVPCLEDSSSISRQERDASRHGKKWGWTCTLAPLFFVLLLADCAWMIWRGAALLVGLFPSSASLASVSPLVILVLVWDHNWPVEGVVGASLGSGRLTVLNAWLSVAA